MESQYNKTKNQWDTTSYSPFKFNKFQMKMEETGIHILISANFLKKGNHSVRVRQGTLYLKIENPERHYDPYGKYLSFEGHKKDMEFRFSLPDKKHRYIHSIRFEHPVLKIHLTDKRRARRAMTFAHASPSPNGLIAS